MSRSINRVQLLGHLGKDVEVRFTPTGVKVAQFTLATSRCWKPKDSQEWKEETDWHRCVLWRCENVANYLLKGKQVYVEGRLQTRAYEVDGVKRYTTEVVVDDLILLGGGDKVSGAAPPAVLNHAPAPGDHGITYEDVPF